MSIRMNSPRSIRRLLIPAILSVLLLSACCPVVTNFSPSSGGEGTELTIRGKRFGSTPTQNRVKIGGISAPNALITRAAEDTLAVRVPADARSGSISVANRQCSGESDDTFTVLGAGYRPDLVPKAIYFDSNRMLHVRVANEGAAMVPPGNGTGARTRLPGIGAGDGAHRQYPRQNRGSRPSPEQLR